MTMRNLKQRTFAPLVALPLCMGVMTAVADDYIPPELVKVTTPLYRPTYDQFKPPLGVYNYTVSWEGIPAASCQVTVSEGEDTFIIEAAARTYSGIDLLYKLRYTATGQIAQEDLSPVSLHIDHRENSRRKNVEVSFAPNTGAIKATRESGQNKDQQTVLFNPHNLTLDPIGAGFLARSLDWHVGDVKHFDVFNGKSRYLITLTAVERTTIEFQGVPRDVFVISPKVRNLTSTKPEAKLREARIYMSADKHRDILKLVSSVFIGSVTTELESFIPASKPEGTVRIASAKRSTPSIR